MASPFKEELILPRSVEKFQLTPWSLKSLVFDVHHTVWGFALKIR